MAANKPSAAASSNPYVAPGEFDIPDDRRHRPWYWIAVVLMQAGGYAVVVIFFGLAGLYTLIGAGTQRPDEAILTLLAFLACPIIVWFLVLEIGGLRLINVYRERLLSRFSMLTTMAPLGLSLFWFYEYFAFGHFAANAVPGFLALLFSAVWFAVSYLRWKVAGSLQQP